MSAGTPGRAPTNTNEFLRDLKARVEALEQRTTVPVGSWRLYENGDGDLVAIAPGGRTVTLSDTPTQVTVVEQITTTTTGT